MVRHMRLFPLLRIFSLCMSIIALIAAFDLRPHLIVKQQCFADILDTVTRLNCLRRNIGNVGFHVCIVQLRMVCSGKFQCRSVWIGVGEFLQHLPEDVALQRIVQPGVGGIGVRRINGNGIVVLP